MSELQQTVFVVDDDDAVRNALRMLMKSVGLECEGFASARKFLESYDPERTGCLVLDIRMPGMSGLELQEKLVEQHSLLPIIFITGHGDVPMAVQAIQHGAVDFIQKPFRDQDLLDRINKALELDNANREKLGERDVIQKRIESLTQREREVLDMVIDGCANKVMAIDMNVSQRTIEIHRAKMMEKMQASSVAHLVRMVIPTLQED